MLHNGIDNLGVKLKVYYFKPESGLNELNNENYKANILGCTTSVSLLAQQHKYHRYGVSLNGIPIVALGP